VFRLLVEPGRDGIPAGSVAEALKIAPNTLTFHFDRLRDAGLVTVRRDGRSMIYSARYETMNALIAYLTENCCRGRANQSMPVRSEKVVQNRARRLIPGPFNLFLGLGISREVPRSFLSRVP
jgi:hypothetical protein